MGEFLSLLVNSFLAMLQMCLSLLVFLAFGLSTIGQLGTVPLVIAWFLIGMIVVEIILE